MNFYACLGIGRGWDSLFSSDKCLSIHPLRTTAKFHSINFDGRIKCFCVHSLSFVEGHQLIYTLVKRISSIGNNQVSLECRPFQFKLRLHESIVPGCFVYYHIWTDEGTSLCTITVLLYTYLSLLETIFFWGDGWNAQIFRTQEIATNKDLDHRRTQNEHKQYLVNPKQLSA